jgi:type I restriction enzyme S subunit
VTDTLNARNLVKLRLIAENDFPTLPETWGVERLRFLFSESKERNGSMPVGEMLSVSEYRGVVPREYENEEQKRTDGELENYRVVRPGQLAVNSMWLNHLGLGVSDFLGHVSPAYSVYNISERLDRRFVHHLMRSNYYLKVYLRYLYGIRPNSFQIKASDWDSIPIIVPDLPTQRAIADFLDSETARIDALIQKKQRLVELLGEKKKADLSQIEDDLLSSVGSVSRLSYHVLKVGSGKTPSGGANVYQDDGVLFLRSQNIKNDSVSLEDVAYISEDIDAELANSRVIGGDVLLNITGASLGRCAVAPADIPAANVNQHVCIIRPMKHLLAEYLHVLLLAPRMQATIRTEAFSAGREGLNFQSIRNFAIPVPADLSVQKAVVGRIRSVFERDGKIIELNQTSIYRLKEYRSALITSAVTGQIDVTKWGNAGTAGRQLEAIQEEMGA